MYISYRPNRENEIHTSWDDSNRGIEFIWKCVNYFLQFLLSVKVSSHIISVVVCISLFSCYAHRIIDIARVNSWVVDTNPLEETTKERCIPQGFCFINIDCFISELNNSFKGRRGTGGCTSNLNVEVVGSNPIKGPRCFLDQDTLPLLLRTGWFQERIRAQINWGPYGRLT